MLKRQDPQTAASYARWLLGLGLLMAVIAQAPAQTPVDSPPVLPAGEPAFVPGPGPGFVWARGDYLLWWLKGDSLPPLLITSPSGTPADQINLATPGTSVLFGNGRVNEDARHGGRIELGWAFDSEMLTAWEGNFLGLAKTSDQFTASSGGDPILARPYFNVNTNRPDSELVAFPGVQTGTISINTSSELLGGEIYLRENLFMGAGFRLDWLAGYRTLYLRENLGVLENLLSTDPLGAVPVNTQIVVSDQFETRNYFHGAEVGLMAELNRGQLTVELLAKLAMGGNHKVVSIGGSTTTTAPGAAAVTQSGGLLALPTNIGRYDGATFAVVPELGINLGYQLTPAVRLYTGYTLIYWTSLSRVGGEIDLGVNPSQIPPGALAGTGRPAFFGLSESGLWIQGLNWGVELRY